MYRAHFCDILKEIRCSFAMRYSRNVLYFTLHILFKWLFISDLWINVVDSVFRFPKSRSAFSLKTLFDFTENARQYH